MLLLLVPGVGMGGSQEASPPPPPPPAPSGPPYQPSGGVPHDHPKRTRRQLSEARRRLGLEDDYAVEQAEAARTIADVAARQASALEQDKQKQYDELARELQLRNIAWKAKYLEDLASQRQKLIDAEIAFRIQTLRKLQIARDEQDLMTLILLAASI
jgi:hypothetical protein